jgi:uncharacterized protein (TIGR00369 family)
MSDEEIRRRIEHAFSFAVPHNRALGLETLAWKPGEITLALPWREDLVGNPETGVLHGGAITSLMDAASGAAVFLAMQPIRRVATLDLRIDYLRPAKTGRAVVAHAVCYHLTQRIAFTRAEAYHEGEPRVLVANAVGTFMIFDDDARTSARAIGRP